MAKQRKLLEIVSSITDASCGQEFVEIKGLKSLRVIAFVDDILFISSEEKEIVKIKGKHDKTKECHFYKLIYFSHL